jgi:hypothetical protein
LILLLNDLQLSMIFNYGKRILLSSLLLLYRGSAKLMVANALMLLPQCY